MDDEENEDLDDFSLTEAEAAELLASIDSLTAAIDAAAAEPRRSTARRTGAEAYDTKALFIERRTAGRILEVR
jgi:hypothetical protein